MQKEKNRESRFFDILNSAEEIHIREVPSAAKGTVYASVDKTLKAFEEKDDGGYHSFVVQVRLPLEKPPSQKSEAAPDPANREKLLKSAEILVRNSELLLARHIYSFLLKANIRDREALRGLGICLLRLADPTAAKKCFKALWELYHQPDALLHLAVSLSEEGDDMAALECLSRLGSPGLLSMDLQFDFYKELGNTQTRLGRFDEANRSYQEALKIRPSSDTLYVNLGTMELQRRQMDLSLLYFEKAFELNPKNAKALCGIGLGLFSRNELDAARVRFESALEIDRQNIVALNQLFHLSQIQDDSAIVKSRLVRFLETQPRHPEVRSWLAACLYQEGRWAECEREVDTILSLDRTHARAQQLKKELTQNRGRA